MPSLLKGFIERIFQPDLIARQDTETAMDWHIFANKSARIVMTMGMPISIYRWWYCGHALKLLTRNVLHFIGVKPVWHTLYGMIGHQSRPRANAGCARSRRWEKPAIEARVLYRAGGAPHVSAHPLFAITGIR